MRIIKLYIEDHELFVKDVDPDDYAFYQSHIATFKRMWKDQGSTFWLRFLINFREYLKTFEYQKVMDKQSEAPICAHILTRCLDEAFIHIHKEFIEGDCSSAKSLLSDIFTLAKNRHLINELESPSLVYDPFYTKCTRDSFRKLFGNPPVNKKAPLIKVWINCPVYLKFGGATCTILRRWLAEDDVCEKDIPDVNNQYQYWMPFDSWTKNEYTPDPFEEHIAKFWDDKLPSMLLTSNVKNIFLRGVPEICACPNLSNTAEDKDAAATGAAFQSLSSQTFGTPCKKHDNCLVKILHEARCSDPQFCSGRSSCIISCENEIQKLAVDKCSKSDSSYWSKFEVVIEPCDKENCRNVGTLCETQSAFVESYLIPEKALFAKNICDFIHGACDFPPNLPPETLNALMQVRKVEGTRERLRNKLIDKKQKVNTEKLLQDSTYRLKMYEQAVIKFRKEMEAEAQRCGCGSWEDHAHDSCKRLNENLHKKDSQKNDGTEDFHVMCKSRVTIITSNIGNVSIAVGTDERSGIGKVLQARKKSIKKSKNSSKPSDEKTIENDKKSIGENFLHGDEIVEYTVTGRLFQGLEDVQCNNKFTDLKKRNTDLSNTCTEKVEVPKSAVEMVEVEESKPEENSTHSIVEDKDLAMKNSAVCKNVDTIENAVQENGGLGYSEIMLMLKTTELLVRNEADSNENEHSKQKKVQAESVKKKVRLHVCAYCKQMETQPSTFKKCSRCKKEKFAEPRYYCRRECQVEDWEESHRDEHQRNAAS